MLKQLSIRQTLLSDHGRRLLATMTPEQFSGRMALARHVCQHFDFVDRTGRLQAASCLAALRELEATGAIRLPRPVARREPPFDRR